MFPRISWTVYSRWERCPEQYRLYRKRKREIPDARRFVVGSAVHLAAQMFIQHKLDHSKAVWFASQDVLRRASEARQQGDYSIDVEYEQELSSKAAGIADHVISTIRMMRDAPGGSPSVLASEVRVTQYFKGWSMEGIVDIVEKFGDGSLRVWDIKTSEKVDKSQLIFYDILLRAVGIRPDVVGWMGPDGRLHSIESTPDIRANMRQQIMKMVTQVSREEFEPTGFPKACGICPSTAWCETYQNNQSGLEIV